MARFRLRPPAFIVTGIGHMGVAGNLQAQTTKSVGSVLLGGRGRTTVSGNVASIAVAWTSAPTYLIQEGVSGTFPLPLTTNGQTVTVAWVSPGGKPAWVSFSAPSSSPTISFSGAQLDANDVANMVLSATVSGQSPINSSPGSITITVPSTSNWRSLTLPLTATPHSGASVYGVGGNKHVMFAWNPDKNRLYSFGGDTGYGAAQYGQPASNTPNHFTNDPAPTKSYYISDAFRMDIYSVNPFSATYGFRLEHPYWPRNIGGSPEDRPQVTCQQSPIYDQARGKFWMFQHNLRYDYDIPGDHVKFLDGNQQTGTIVDPWGSGPSCSRESANANAPETHGLFSWTASANPPDGIASTAFGTFVKESNNYVWGGMSAAIPIAWPPTYVGNVLRILGEEAYQSGHGYLGYWAQYLPADKFISLTGANAGTTLVMIIFDPTKTGATVQETFQYRRFNTTGYSFTVSHNCQVAVIGDYAYVNSSTNFGGVRKSQILRVNIPAALARSNGDFLAANEWSFFDAPFTFSPTGEWESVGSGGYWSQQCGLIAVNGVLTLIASYGNLVINNVTRIAHTTNPEAAIPTWTMGESFPGPAGKLDARTWCAVPPTGEVALMSSDFSGTDSPANVLWFYKVPSAAQTPIEAFAEGMTPGTMVEFTTNNWTAMLQPNEAFLDGNLNGQYGNLAEFADRMIRDDVAKKNYFVGCSRGGADSSAVIAYQCAGTEDLHSGYLCYDEVTNSWSRSPESFMVSGGPHAYDHMAIDPETQDRYRFEGGSSNGVWKYTKSTGQWTESPRPSIGTGIAPTGALVWAWDALFYIDGGAGYEPKIWRRPRGSTTWTIWQQHTHPTGYEALFGEYSPTHDCIYFGGGSGAGKYSGGTGGGSSAEIVKTFCRVTADGAIARLTNPPGDLKVGLTTASGHQSIDPVSGDLLCFSPVPTAGDGHIWSWNGAVWTQHGTHPLVTPGSMGIQAIFSVNKDAGVVMAMNWNGGLGSKVYLYKHAPAPRTLTGLDWDGTAVNGSTRRAIKFNAPPPAYPMTVGWKIYQRANTTGTYKYYTTYFWGIDGDFTGGVNHYHGCHPYPQPANTSTTAKWELSTNGGDYMGRGTNTDPTGPSAPFVTNNAWYSQANIVSSASSSSYNHKFYIALPSVATNDFIERNLTGTPQTAPSNSCFVWGQAPMNNAGNASWGGYDRFEETNGILRGMYIFTAALSQAHVVALRAFETDTDFLAYCDTNSLTASLWYLNMNPKPTDIADRSGKGNHPVWEGTGRPTLWTG